MTRHNRKRKKPVLREYAEIIVLAVALALFVRTFFVQAFRIPSESMEDTLLVGDFLFANKFVYGAKLPFLDTRLPAIRDPKPGDIIIFKYPGDRKTDYIKRCVAVEGQTVEIKGRDVYVDGVLQDESHVKWVLGRPEYSFGPYEVEPGHIFMMGDNRDNSADSRAWGFLPKENVVGEALIIYWSWNKNAPLYRIFSKIRFGRIGDLIR